MQCWHMQVKGNKDAYRTWCRETIGLPIFMQDWWLDAVCIGKEWDAILLPSGAMMPYLLRKRLGMRFTLMPQHTQIAGYLGNADSPSDIAKAIDALGLAYYYQKFPLNQSWVPELRAYGFTVNEMVTYRITDLSDEKALISRFSENKRRQIKKAALLQVDETLRADQFYTFHQLCLKKQHKPISYTLNYWKTLYEACIAHQAGKLIGLRDVDDELTAAVFLVYDGSTCYYLIPTYDPEKGSNGAGARLVLESIRFAAQLHLAFDFEGSMIPGIANHYRQFGSTPTTYFSVEKTYNPLFKLLLWGNSILNRKKK